MDSAFREQVYYEMIENNEDVSKYPKKENPKALMESQYDESELAAKADELIKQFQKDASEKQGFYVL